MHARILGTSTDPPVSEVGAGGFVKIRAVGFLIRCL